MQERCLFYCILCLLVGVFARANGQTETTIRSDLHEYTGFVIVELAVDEGENGTIYYTLNGGEPEPGVDLKYESNFTITQDSTIKAVYIDDQGDRGETLTINVVVPMTLATIAFNPTSEVFTSGQQLSIIPSRSTSGDLLLFQICNLTSSDTTCDSQEMFLSADQSSEYKEPFPVPTQAGRYKLACVLIPQHTAPLIFATLEFVVVQQCGVPGVPESAAFFAPGQIFVDLSKVVCPYVSVLVATTNAATKAYEVTVYDAATGIVFDSAGNYSVTVTVVASSPWKGSAAIVRQYLVATPRRNLIARVDPDVRKDLIFEERLAALLQIPSSRLYVTNITRDATLGDSSNFMLFYFGITLGSPYLTTETSDFLRYRTLSLPLSSTTSYGILGVWEEGEQPVIIEESSSKLSVTVWVLISLSAVFALCCVVLIGWECRRRIGVDEEMFGPPTPSYRWDDSSPTYEELSDKQDRDTNKQVSDYKSHPPSRVLEPPVDILYTSGPLLPYPPHELPPVRPFPTSPSAFHSSSSASGGAVNQKMFAQMYATV